MGLIEREKEEPTEVGLRGRDGEDRRGKRQDRSFA